VSFDGERLRIDWKLDEGIADWPSGRLVFANGEFVALQPAPVAPLRARAVMVPAAPGRALLETAAGRVPIETGAWPERGLPVQTTGWAERWAAAGGGVVRTLDDVEDWRPSRASRRQRVPVASWLIALAALVAFADLCAAPRRRTIEGR
jgi:hypothetical protein